ncbi:hypothetical protein G6F33_005059 [Rhizopus arrhizus]|nr:hypothetical protein G6F23_004511 [Rhizopus arrhizus]KAG0768128.1 hypothetical protein G6F24_002203 [Rhizopus arrhizus]KAG0913549.1 hypothetical protein G6F33_005059 [Rhizopus arrhizus]KAG1382630.1 hypothetical protein G6F61_002082 [Rhizopus arrhizus]
MNRLFKKKNSKNIQNSANQLNTRIDDQVSISSETLSKNTDAKKSSEPIFSHNPIKESSIQQDEEIIKKESNVTDMEEERDIVKELKTSLTDAGTTCLVEATMDQAQARDRHIRFQEHVVESATLVQHMLNMKSGKSTTAVDSAMYNNNAQHDDETRSFSMPFKGIRGSVLASLMKLEAQRYGGEKNRKKSRRNSKHEDTLKNRKPTSLYNFPIHTPDEPLHSPTKLKRPALRPRSVSWLSGVTSSKYVVPSLEKRKKSNGSTLSRRSSSNSLQTTASQFEPITLEDRIRITFEIANILQKQEFLRKLCRSLIMYGCPAHRLEYAMRQVSHTLGVDAEYVYIPSVMLMTFYDSTTHTTETHFIRQSPGFDMHRLCDIYRLEKLVAYGEVSVDEALEFIDKVNEQPSIYPRWLLPFIYSIASFSGCVLFYGGRWREGGIAAALGMLFAVNELFSTFVSSLQPIWEITVCILIGFVARGLQYYGFCFIPIAFSSFIVVLPGYPMIIAIIELVSRQLVNGVVRMVYAVIYSFLLGYGVSLGSSLYLAIDKNATTDISEQCKLASSVSTCIASESQWFNFFLVPLFGIAFCLYLKAKFPRWPIMLAFASSSYIINYALSCWAHAPSQILQIAPAFCVALVGNIISKFTGMMTFDAVLLGIFYLLPSGLGVKAALGLFSKTNETGSEGAGFALVMIETSIGITLGLFLATLLVYPKGSQRTPLMSL